jgi:hypothetical protein
MAKTVAAAPRAEDSCQSSIISGTHMHQFGHFINDRGAVPFQ